ncbi:MAG: MtrB/PioB family outer membrane beta-barrel protein [Armatimonadota bacterium]|nr:MtrB/PioB family outer membrane beta-barrel protein [Armatimonadota bacterium]
MKKMKTVTYILITAFLFGAVLPGTVLAQTSLVDGEDTQSEVRLGVYNHDASGNQDWVREFDGRPFDIGTELIDVYGYKGPLQYWFGARDLVVQDETTSVELAWWNLMGLRLETDKLTHNLARIPSINPFLDGTTASGDVFNELAPDQNLVIERRIYDLGFNVTPGNDQKVRFVADWWQEQEHGAKQVLFYSRAALPGEPPAASPRARQGSALIIDRSAVDAGLGADFALGKSSAMSYRFVDTRFNDDAGNPPPGTTVYPGLNRIVQPDIEAKSHIIKARTQFGDKFYFTGVHTIRDRDNRTSTLNSLGVPVPRVNNIKTDATNVAMSFLATDGLTLTGRYRKYELDNRVPPVLVGGVADNQAVSRDETALSLDATLTGIPRTFLRAGFERRNTDRRFSALHPGHEEFEHPFTSENTESDIWRAGLRYYPTPKFSINGNFEKWNIDGPGFAASFTDREKVDLSATYLISDSFGVYGNYNRWDEENSEIRVPVASIPTPAVDDPGEEARLDAAGQGYRNKTTTTNLGAWYALNSKLSLDANIGKVKTDSAALWIIGLAPAYPPHLLPDFAPYQADFDMWAVGLTYAFRPSWKLFGRFQQSDSDGRTLVSVIPGDVSIEPVWQPVRVTEDRWTLGFGYDISVKDSLSLDFSTSDWEDKIDGNQSGRFNLWRLAWSHRY